MPTDQSSALLTEPMTVVAYLAAVLGLIFWASTQPALKKFFRIIPPVILAYFIPTLSTAAGITPLSSSAYEWMTRYLLPIALLLLMIAVDLKAILRLGGIALIMMLAGTVGIILGGPISLAVFGQWLPADAWMGFAALSGSWIGGTANMVAIAESVGTPDGALGPVIVIDTVVGYGWMGVLLFASAWQGKFDTWNNARREALDEASDRLEQLTSNQHPISLRDATMILGLGLAGAVIAIAIGQQLPSVGNPTIISNTTWAVLIVVTVGLMLSFTPVQRLEAGGASKMGYLALYFLLTAIGAQADLKAVLDTPVFFLAGILWISIHVAILFGVARLIRAPLFFLACGSMANVGGAASAPVVAGIYHPALAPVGLLMGVSGYILGIYGGLLAAYLLSLVGG